jgi:hypothetical protein
VLLVDQLEELATVSGAEGRAFTAALLAQLAEHALPGVRALVAARRDLLDPLLGIEGLGPALIHGSVLIEPVGELTWGAILDRALAAYGYTLEDDALRDAIMAEIGRTASAMPLVMFALTELWDRRDTRDQADHPPELRGARRARGGAGAARGGDAHGARRGGAGRAARGPGNAARALDAGGHTRDAERRHRRARRRVRCGTGDRGVRAGAPGGGERGGPHAGA